jgi:hypothetical protein
VRLRVDLDFHFSGNCPKPRMTDPAISWREISIALIEATNEPEPEGVVAIDCRPVWLLLRTEVIAHDDC